MVSEAVARAVADQELEAHARDCEGVHGLEAARRALELGLAGIAEQLEERAEGWIVTDLITTARIFRFHGREITPRQATRLGTKYRLPVRLAR